MTIKEKLRIHHQIEQENKAKLKKWGRKEKIKQFYSQCCRNGQYYEARDLLKILKNGSVVLGLDDASANVEIFLEDIGLKPYYGRNYCSAKFTLR